MPDNPITTEEIDALMQAVQSGQVSADGIEGSEPANEAVKLYDFARPDKFSKEQIRTLEMIYTNCARGMTTQLSTLLRAGVEADATLVAEISYQEFFESLSNPAAIALLSIEPLVGRAVMEIDPELAFALIDRLLGGAGQALTVRRELTEIEKGLVGRIVERVGKCITDSWSTLITMKPRLDMIIGSSLFSQVALPDDRMVLASFTVKIGHVSGNLRFGVPVTALDPVLSKLSAHQWFSAGNRTNNEELTQSIRQYLDNAVLPLTVTLGTAQVTVGDLLDLQAGDLVCLDRKAGADLEVKVGSRLAFQGLPGQAGRRLAVKITKVMDGGEGG